MANDSSELEIANKKLAQMERQVNTILDISRIAQETTDVGYFIYRCLELLAKMEAATVGQMWQTSADGEYLQCAKEWFGPSDASEFRAVSAERRFTKGLGLPGRAWGTGTAISVEDVSTDNAGLAFPRVQAAVASRLKFGLAIPVRHGAQVTGVLELFGPESKTIDRTQLMFYEKVGTFLGSFFAEKRSAAQIYENNLLHRAILDKTEAAFIGMEETGLIFAWNKRAEEIFGWTRESALGKQLVDMIIPHRYREAHIKGLFRYLASGHGAVLDQKIRTPALHESGREIPIEMMIFPVELMGRKRFGAFISDAQHEPKAPDIVLT